MPATKEEKNDSKSKKEICGSIKVKEAVNALKLLNKKFVETNLKKQPLLEDTSESPIYLQLMLKKIPPPQLLRMIRVPLPHSLVAETSDICLITGDLEKRNHKAEIEPTVLHYKDLLKKHGVTKVSQVIPLRQLRTEYKTFESKRHLAAAYDVFLVDKKIAGVMAKTLGKSFLQNRKFPIQIDMKRPNLKDQIDKALCQTEFSLTCRGNSYALEVARLSMEDKAIVENINTCIKVLEDKLPGSTENILSLYLKTAKSKAIPIYVSLDIPDNIVIKKPRKNNKYKLDELSTLDNADVKVFRDGRVILKKTKEESNSEDEKDQEIDLNESFTDEDSLESKEDTKKFLNKALKKKKRKASDEIRMINDSENEEVIQDSVNVSSNKKKKSKKTADVVKINTVMENEEIIEDSTLYKTLPKKKKKGKKYASADETTDVVELDDEEIQGSVEISTKKKKKGKKSTSADETTNVVELDNEEIQDSVKISPKKKKSGRKSILEQVSEKTDLKSEGETRNSSFSLASSKKKNKKNKGSSSVEADVTIIDVQDSIHLDSKKRKINSTDNVTEKALKDKKRKVSENVSSDEMDNGIKPETRKSISKIAEEINVETTLKSKGKKKAKGDAAENELSFISMKGDEISQDEKTPLKSKRNKKSIAEFTADNDVNSLSKLNKRRKSDRKSISAL